MLSIYISFKIGFKNYKFNDIFNSIKKDKTAFFLSLGTKIGVGSIIGTVSSIIIGGISALIWMYIFSFLTSSLIYYESLLGYKYRKEIKGEMVGGPFYIIKYGNKKNILAYISLILLLITYSFLFQMIQTNTISNIIVINTNIKLLTIFISFSIVLYITIKFSIKEVLSSMNKIVPFMCLLFIIVCFYMIISNASLIVPAIKYSFKGLSFNGFFFGSVIGIKRSIFMNETLIGTTSLSSGTDKNDSSTSVNIQVLGTYFISFVITSLVSLLVIIYMYNYGILTDYNMLISSVFYNGLGKTGIFILMVIFILFGVTTILSGYYIGKSNIEYLTNNKIILLVFKLLFCFFTLLGIFINSNFIWKYIDIFMFIMIIINIYSIITLLRNEK